MLRFKNIIKRVIANTTTWVTRKIPHSRKSTLTKGENQTSQTLTWQLYWLNDFYCFFSTTREEENISNMIVINKISKFLRSSYVTWLVNVFCQGLINLERIRCNYRAHQVLNALLFVIQIFPKRILMGH